MDTGFEGEVEKIWKAPREHTEEKKDRRPVTFPVVNIETPPLEINLQRKASSLLRNVNRASVR
jgi:hypothetical protein